MANVDDSRRHAKRSSWYDSIARAAHWLAGVILLDWTIEETPHNMSQRDVLRLHRSVG